MSAISLLYGSHARGDADQLSDRDVLRVGRPEHEDYSWDDIAAMHSYGSLFLHHLKHEGKLLEGDASAIDRWKSLMNTLPAYIRALDDLRSFEFAAADIDDALRRGDSSLAFEAASTARLVRHLAILACYVSGSPDYTRYGAVKRAASTFGISLPEGIDFQELYRSLNDCEHFAASVDTIREWLDFSKNLIGVVRVSVERREYYGNT